MTYGRVSAQETCMNDDGPAVSHLAELVRGTLMAMSFEGPLAPALSPRGEGDRGARVWTTTEEVA